MSAVTEQYRSYLITVSTMRDHEDLWDFRYTITRPGDSQQHEGAPSVSRSQTMGGHLTPEIAARAGLEVARIEIDNRLAMGQS